MAATVADVAAALAANATATAISTSVDVADEDEPIHIPHHPMLDAVNAAKLEQQCSDGSSRIRNPFYFSSIDKHGQFQPLFRQTQYAAAYAVMWSKVLNPYLKQLCNKEASHEGPTPKDAIAMITNGIIEAVWSGHQKDIQPNQRFDALAFAEYDRLVHEIGCQQ